MPPPTSGWRQADCEAIHRSSGSHWSGSNGGPSDVALAAWAFLLSAYYGTHELTIWTTSIVQDEDVSQDAEVPPKWRLATECTITIALDRLGTVDDLFADIASARQAAPCVGGQRNHSTGIHYGPPEDSVLSSLLVLAPDVHGAADRLTHSGFSHFDLTGDYPYDLVVRPPTCTDGGEAVFEALFDDQLQDHSHVIWLLARYEELIRVFCDEPRAIRLSTLEPPLSASTSSGHASEHEPDRLPAPETKEADLEQVMIQAWSDVLEVPHHAISRSSRFQDLGGNSLDAMKLAVRLQLRGYHLSVADIFQKPDLAALAEVTKYDHSLESERPVAPQTMPHPPHDDIAVQCAISATSIEDVYPATPFQEATIALTLKDTGSYLTTRTFELAEHVDVLRLRAAWQAVCAANPILRRRFVYLPEHGMLQIVVADGPQWAEMPSREDQMSEDHGRRWALGDPCLRLELFGPDHLRVTMHHAIYDGWSLGLIFSDLDKYYHGQGPIARPSYKVFAEYLQTVDAAESETYWRSRLAGVSFEPFPKPSDIWAQPLCTGKSETSLQLDIPNPLMATAATLATAAWGLVLSRYSDSSDVSFGYISSGRSVPVDRVDTVVGPFICSVPMRVTVDRSTTVQEFLRQVQTDLLEMGPYAHYGLQNIQKLSQDTAHACAFRNTFVVRPSQEDFPSLDIVKPASGQNMTLADYQTYPLNGSCSLDRGRVRVRLRFDPEILSQSQADGFLGFYGRMLTGLASIVPDATIADLWKRPSSIPYLAARPPIVAVDRCVHEMIEDQARSHPESEAICSWDGSCTFGELDRLSRKLSHYLRRKGVGPNTYVCFSFEKSTLAIVAILAILKAGGACVPLDISLPPDRTRQIVNKSRASIVVCSSEQAARLRGDTTVELAVIDSTMLSDLPESQHSPGPSVGAEDVSFAVFTSGSTALPKGCVWTHRTLSSSATANGAALGLDRRSRVLQYAAFMWDVSILESVVTLVRGGCVCLPSEEMRLNDPLAFMTWSRVNTAIFTPTFVRSVRLEDVDCLETLCVGGEVVGQDTIESYRSKFRLLGGYGPSETCMCVAIADYSADATLRSGNLGHSTSVHLWIVDPQDPHILMPDGAAGDIVMEGPGVGRGYLDDPAQTSSAFLCGLAWAHGTSSSRVFYRSGDIGRRNGDGTVTFIRRKDDQVKYDRPTGKRVLGHLERH